MTDEPRHCGDPISGIGCTVPGCTHDDLNDPNVAAYTAAFLAAQPRHARTRGGASAPPA